MQRERQFEYKGQTYIVRAWRADSGEKVNIQVFLDRAAVGSLSFITMEVVTDAAGSPLSPDVVGAAMDQAEEHFKKAN
jgi:hypothetical protein